MRRKDIRLERWLLRKNRKQAAAAVVDLSNVVQQNTSKITTLWDAVFGDITTNPFQITFANLDGITLTSGVWNATLQRLEC